MLNWLRRRNQAPPRVTSKPDPGHRIYAIGDVHGRHDLLGDLLARLREDARAQGDGRRNILVLLGDYIDRGDHSREVVDLILAEASDPDAGPWDRIIPLRGNHEAALLDFIETPADGAAWLGFGGKQTLASYGVPVPKSRAPDISELTDTAARLSRAMGDHVAFLNRTAKAWRSGAVVFAHSGIHPGVPLDAQTEDATLWGHSPFLEEGPPDGLRVVHGHWDAPEPVVTPARICLDTGAYYTGRLTAARIDSGTELIQADALFPMAVGL